MEMILIEKSVWLNSQLSVARFSGGIMFNGKYYNILGKEEDLVREDWEQVYIRLGRERIIEILMQGVTLSEAKKIKPTKGGSDEKNGV
jgi:hypothetical protein